MEEWRPIKITEGRYEVSSLGRVKRVLTGRILKPRVNKFGYIKYVFYDNYRTRITMFAHRIVAAEFIRDISPGEEVDHLNMVRWDNRVSNLDVVSRLINMQRSHNSGARNTARGSRQHLSVITNETAVEIRRRSALGEFQNAIARDLGISNSIVNRVVLRRTWTHV